MPPFPVEPRYKSATSLTYKEASASSDSVLRKLQQARCTRLSIEPTSPNVAVVRTTHASSGSDDTLKTPRSGRKAVQQNGAQDCELVSSPITPVKGRSRISNCSPRRPPRIPLTNDESKLADSQPLTPISSRNNSSPDPCPLSKPTSPKNSTQKGRNGVSQIGKPDVEGKTSRLVAESTSWCVICKRDNGTKAAHTCELRLNQVGDAEIYAFFETVPGLGRRLANRVILARAEAGPFMSAADFDRRMSRLSFTRLSSAAMSCSFSVSLDITMRQMPGRAIAGCSIQMSINPEAIPPVKQKPASTPALFTLSTWNAAHLSLRSRFIKKKMEHFVRFIVDAAPLVVALQEVYGDVPDFIASSLTTSGCNGEQWSSCSPETQQNSDGSNNAESMMQAFCYRSDAIIATDLSAVVPETLFEGFLRPPAVAMFSPRSEDIGVIHEHTIALVNVHLSTRFFASEVSKLPAVLDFVREHVSALGGNPDLVMCLGDFNVSADAECFDTLKETGFTELIRPPNPTNPGENKQYITTPTTVGGNWYDNILMTRFARESLENAWCFDFGGRCAALADTSAYEYAGHRRSQRSDHLAVVAQYRFS